MRFIPSARRVVAVAALLLLAGRASAASVTFDLDVQFDNLGSPTHVHGVGTSSLVQDDATSTLVHITFSSLTLTNNPYPFTPDLSSLGADLLTYNSIYQAHLLFGGTSPTASYPKARLYTQYSILGSDNATISAYRGLLLSDNLQTFAQNVQANQNAVFLQAYSQTGQFDQTNFLSGNIVEETLLSSAVPLPNAAGLGVAGIGLLLIQRLRGATA